MQSEMPRVQLGLETWTPAPLRISEIGWPAFLAEWDRRARELISARAIHYGVGRTADDNAFFIKKLHESGVTDIDSAFARWNVPGSSPPTDTDKAMRFQELRRAAAKLVKLEALQPLPYIDASFLANDTLGAPGADAELIAEAERRLESKLPESYRQFISVSNGWSIRDTPLLPLQQVDLFRNKDPESFGGWTEGPPPTWPSDRDYFVYDRRQYEYNLRTDYFKDLLLISSRGEDNIMDILVNPRVVFEDGEWEAWKLSTHYAGAKRFKSFGKLMEWLYCCEIAAFGKSLSKAKSDH